MTNKSNNSKNDESSLTEGMVKENLSSNSDLNSNNNENDVFNSKRMLWLETYLPIGIMLLYPLYYNAISSFAARRSLDFGSIMQLPIDVSFPFIPLFVIPYLMTWIYPFIMLIYLAKNVSSPQLVLRRIVCSVILLALLSSIIHFIFPTHYPFRVESIINNPDTILEKLVAYTYIIEPAWNETPSTHVAFPWLIYRALTVYLPINYVLRIFKAFFVLTAISVMAIKIHFFVDIIAGILIAELIYRLVLRRMELTKSLAQVSPWVIILIYCTTMLATSTMHIVS